MKRGLTQVAFGVAALSFAGCATIDAATTAFEAADAQAAAAAPAVASPWDSLSGEEIERATEIVKAAHGEAVLFTEVGLLRPEKAAALQWTEGETPARQVRLTYFAQDGVFEGEVDLADGTLQTEPLTSIQPMFSSEGELLPVVIAAQQDPQMRALLTARGVAPEATFCAPRTVGNFGQGDEDGARMVKLDCFDLSVAKTSAYGRPIEGLLGVYDLDQGAFVEVRDLYAPGDAPPIAPDSGNFDEETIPPRERLNAIRLQQSGGGNVQRSGSRVDWQNWRFHVRFDPKQGAVLNRVEYNDDGDYRSVAYEVAMSEMFVPYQDPTQSWYYRNYFDMGYYGFGASATALQGADCPAYADKLDVVMAAPTGEPAVAEDRICIFEQDTGLPLWRHDESVLGNHHESRPATELVVRMASTIGNYDYYQDYIFSQNGAIRIRVTSTGIDAVKGVKARHLSDDTAQEDTAYGPLIAPGLAGVNHDHFFNYRIDLDVDGQANRFERHKLRARDVSAQSPKRSVWVVDPEIVSNELAARTRINPDRPALLLVTNPGRTNALGYPASYQIAPKSIARPLVDPSDPANARAAFTQSDVWITPYAPDELYAAGEFANQSSPGQGLPQWTAAGRSIQETDLVAWVTIGFHHVPAPEDWPVLPSKSDEIVLRPRNFFDRSAAIDVPAEQIGDSS